MPLQLSKNKQSEQKGKEKKKKEVKIRKRIQRINNIMIIKKAF